ncbi:GntR family transcriptional regulator [Streptomyces sp. NPDC090127]|uniref:GntR family transcriptional regulator n=1 Tax=Streptomyces sp. NPDC090127 TaxID=3365953 RepID=UPI00380B3F10
MTSPQRHQLPPAPAYVRIAAHLEREIMRGHLAAHTRLAPERALAEEFAVNRQTIRAALQWLRERGLVVTDRRGTYVNGAARRPRTERTAPGTPSGGRVAPAGGQGVPAFPLDLVGSLSRGHLFSAPVPPATAELLGIPPHRPTLTHRQRFVDHHGEETHEAVTHFTPVAVVEIPELSRYVTRLPVTDPDLRLLHQWLARAGIRPAVTETVTVTRRDPQAGTGATPEITVRRRLHDHRGRLLAVTDVTFHDLWQEITLSYAGGTAGSHHVRPAPPHDDAHEHRASSRHSAPRLAP